WLVVAVARCQALAVGIIALTAALGRGFPAGVVILGALTLFSLGRALGSITSKDIQGRTIPKGERGQINGLSTTASGLVVITLGLGIRYFGGDDLSGGQIAWLLNAGALLLGAVAVVYAGFREPAGKPGPAPTEQGTWFADML